MITVTSKDALRAKQLRPGWRQGTVVSCVPKTAGTDGSLLYTWSIEVVEPGIPIPVPLKDYQVSEKAVSMGKAFFIACGFPKEEWDKLEKGEETAQQIDENACVGKEILVFVKNSEYQGRISNEGTDFLPKGSNVPLLK